MQSISGDGAVGCSTSEPTCKREREYRDTKKIVKFLFWNIKKSTSFSEKKVKKWHDKRISSTAMYISIYINMHTHTKPETWTLNCSFDLLHWAKWMHNKYVILNLTYFSLSLKFFGCPFCFGDEARISLPGLSCCFNSLNCICMRVFVYRRQFCSVSGCMSL